MFRAVLLFCLLIATSCGFKPLYQNSKEITKFKIKIDVQTSDKSGLDSQTLVKSLTSKLQLKNSKPSKLRLKISLNRSSFGLGLQKDLTTTTYGIIYSAKYTFYDRKGIVTTGNIEKQSSFDFGNNPYANLVAEETANKNIIESLATDIATYTLTLRNFSRKIYP